jgi:hypothetical protein
VEERKEKEEIAEQLKKMKENEKQLSQLIKDEAKSIDMTNDDLILEKKKIKKNQDLLLQHMHENVEHDHDLVEAWKKNKQLKIDLAIAKNDESNAKDKLILL